MITQTIDLCMIPGSTNPVIHVNQYDTYPGGLIFNLYEESAFEIPAGAAVTINGTKPDKYGFSYTASYSGNVVTADLEQQMTAVAGNVECELRVTQGDQIIGTQNFTLAVEEAALSDETVISDSDIPAIANAERYASEAAASADDAEVSADAAAGSAESAAASAEAAAQDFSNAVKYTDIVNNGTYSGTAGEKVLDAAMGKTLTDSIDTKVAKSGDTMIGSLNIMATDITIGDVPASSTTFSVNRLNFVDSNGVRIGYITPFYRNTDVVGFDISVTRVINGANAFNSYKIELAAGGGNTIKLTDPGAWRDALGLSGLGTWTDVTPSAGTNVSNISYSMARYNPLLKLCCLDINIRINATSLASSENLLTGLPKPTAMMQAIIGASNNDIVNVKITTTGYLQVDGAKTLTASGKYFNGYITYPYSSLS